MGLSEPGSSCPTSKVLRQMHAHGEEWIEGPRCPRAGWFRRFCSLKVLLPGSIRRCARDAEYGCGWLIRTALAQGPEYFVSNGWTDYGEKAQVVLRDGQFFTSNHCATWRYLG